jgi:creatinine amidohydrolase
VNHAAKRLIAHLAAGKARSAPLGQPSIALGDLTWPAVAEIAANRLLVVPLGATEQHGPHLPLSTDTQIAVALAQRFAARRADVVVAPAVAYGSSGEHAGFVGTLSIGADALKMLVVELGRSADAFSGVVLISGHGGNVEPVSAAAALLQGEGRRVLAWTPRIREGDAHAGRTETSLLLSVRPDAVRLADACRGDERPLVDLLPLLREHGVAAVSDNGVLGDPTGATGAEGAALLEALVDDLDADIRVWQQ